jgi:hypothetical protein
MTPPEIYNFRRGYDDDWRPDSGGRITRPGKFEGENVYVPYFWEITLDGGVCQSGNGTWSVEVDLEDRKIFPEISKRKRRVVLFEDSNGFVKEA